MQVFQRREDGSIDFYLDWTSYKEGFGNITGEHWLGNDNIYTLSNNEGRTYELRVDLNDGTESKFALYENFLISDESDKYRLTLGAYVDSSDAGKPTKHVIDINYQSRTWII